MAATMEIIEDCEVKLVQHQASDDMVVHAARVSSLGEEIMRELERFQVIHRGQWETKEMAARDAGLINFLMRDRHGSPFEHGMFTFFVKAPIFVFREFQRHRIASYNEESGRYKELAGQFYMPPANRPLQQVGKPGDYKYVQGPADLRGVVTKELELAYRTSWDCYQRMLEAGAAREVARMALPVGIYSSMYVTCNPRSLMNFLSLRVDDDRAMFKTGPQWEIDKLVAQRMEDYFALYMPVTYNAFIERGRVAP